MVQLWLSWKRSKRLSKSSGRLLSGVAESNMMGNGSFGDMFNFDGMFDFGNDAEEAEDDNQEDEE